MANRTSSWWPRIVSCSLWTMLAAVLLWVLVTGRAAAPHQTRDGREEVVFWHFWGGADKVVVDGIVDRFNSSQSSHFVRAIALPGNNLDLKLFLSITGGDPPDLVNQDDPILGDWAARGALIPLTQLVAADQIDALRDWLFPAARRLGEYSGQMYGLCNALDVRALYYNRTLLDELDLDVPQTIEQLDQLATTIAPPGQANPTRLGFLPNPRNLWCWGIVFGGRFFDPQQQRPTLDDPGVQAALEWMSGYGRQYGTSAVAFRAKDQSLPGKTFPLLAKRYGAVVDGQWRVRDIEAHGVVQRQRGEPVTRFGATPLPVSSAGLENAGWINGNFFVVPRGAKNQAGAWEFMKFWSGFGGHAGEAAKACAAGGWIPVSDEVVAQPQFQSFLTAHPLFRVFVELAASDNQQPRPNIVGAQLLDRTVREVAETAMYRVGEQSLPQLLLEANRLVQQQMETIRSEP